MSRHYVEQKFGFSRGEMGWCSGVNSWMVQEPKQDTEQDVHVRGRGGSARFYGQATESGYGHGDSGSAFFVVLNTALRFMVLY